MYGFLIIFNLKPDTITRFSIISYSECNKAVLPCFSWPLRSSGSSTVRLHHSFSKMKSSVWAEAMVPSRMQLDNCKSSFWYLPSYGAAETATGRWTSRLHLPAVGCVAGAAPWQEPQGRCPCHAAAARLHLHLMQRGRETRETHCEPPAMASQWEVWAACPQLRPLEGC